MLHPYIRPRIRDLGRARRWPEHASSDEIARVAAQHVEAVYVEGPPSTIGMAEVAVVVLGLLALSWALGGGC